MRDITPTEWRQLSTVLVWGNGLLPGLMVITWVMGYTSWPELLFTAAPLGAALGTRRGTQRHRGRLGLMWLVALSLMGYAMREWHR